ncbi:MULTISPECIES: ABC transporter ATP-binding protein [unclassified Micromonospora]|uniref:ABC transporter ATP-binding protein n=1 Tax=unclassified Micromonospora TaxID=2617518 RepID=UPI001034B285|nr:MULTISPECIES: ABC transporter ATP-binding protein [unclassified Micromonospora]QKW12828.1 ABC transporter ATP-binding protein [Verrucosispora sp. NA02020]TBL28290.1 ABC transporter ATP-binding protein [Verrucosispora sp. SN26_14.1]
MTSDAIPVAELIDISKSYPGGHASAVRGVNLELREGEFFSLLGPSGCGKSTTLRIVAGLETQTTGTVRIKGEDMGRRPANRRPTNMVFQHLGLFPHLDVAQNIAFGPKLRRVPRERRAADVDRVLELVELSGYQRRYPEQLSGGQQQRVAIARALINRPAVLLLDEPLAALDLNLRHQMQQVLREVQRNSGTTFLFVTHDQTEAMTLSDRIGVMRDGELCQVGGAEDLYRRPADRFVARFIGDANVLEIPVEQGSARIGESAVRVAAEGTGVALSVRPEDVRIRPDTTTAGTTADDPDTPAGTDTPPGLAARITGATYLGPQIRYDLETVDGFALRAVRPANADRLPVGDLVTVRWRPEDAVVLSA